MKVIYKYEIIPSLSQTIALPQGSQVLHVGEQGKKLYLWAMVDPSAPAVSRKVEVVGTGWKKLDMPPVAWHAGTVQTSDHFVWHVFVAPE